MRFTDEVVEPNDRKKDPDLRRKMETWHQAFMSVLVEYNKRFKEEGNSEPAKVKDHTLMYQQKSDLILEYINDRLEDAPDHKMIASELYDDFKFWCTDSKNIKVAFDRKGFETELGIKKEPMVDGKFTGFKIKEKIVNNLDPN
jgi:phage/plasmid-associated DNA primase